MGVFADIRKALEKVPRKDFHVALARVREKSFLGGGGNAEDEVSFWTLSKDVLKPLLKQSGNDGDFSTGDLEQCMAACQGSKKGLCDLALFERRMLFNDDDDDNNNNNDNDDDDDDDDDEKAFFTKLAAEAKKKPVENVPSLPAMTERKITKSSPFLTGLKGGEFRNDEEEEEEEELDYSDDDDDDDDDDDETDEEEDGDDAFDIAQAKSTSPSSRRKEAFKESAQASNRPTDDDPSFLSLFLNDGKERQGLEQRRFRTAEKETTMKQQQRQQQAGPAVSESAAPPQPFSDMSLEVITDTLSGLWAPFASQASSHGKPAASAKMDRVVAPAAPAVAPTLTSLAISRPPVSAPSSVSSMPVAAAGASVSAADSWTVMISTLSMATSLLAASAGLDDSSQAKMTKKSSSELSGKSSQERERSAKELASEMAEAEIKAKARADAAAKASAATKVKLQAAALAKHTETLKEKLKEAEAAAAEAAAAEAAAVEVGAVVPPRPATAELQGERTGADPRRPTAKPVHNVFSNEELRAISTAQRMPSVGEDGEATKFQRKGQQQQQQQQQQHKKKKKSTRFFSSGATDVESEVTFLTGVTSRSSATSQASLKSAVSFSTNGGASEIGETVSSSSPRIGWSRSETRLLMDLVEEEARAK